ncbi:uncharacterized protein LOC144750120, partial [Ciona intestinalis]
MTESAVTLKLPTFWTEQARVWFQQTEAQFALRKITCDETKYFYVVSSLDEKTASRLVDLLEEPPRDNKYGKIKQRLLDVFSLSEYERAAKLLNIKELGNQKPSELMDEMLSLMCGHTNCFVFRYIFLQALPEEIRLVVAKEDFEDPRATAQQADVLWNSQSHDYHISKVKKRDEELQNFKTRTRNAPKLCYYHER